MAGQGGTTGGRVQHFESVACTRHTRNAERGTNKGLSIAR